jgi:hypothetical protein
MFTFAAGPGSGQDHLKRQLGSEPEVFKPPEEIFFDPKSRPVGVDQQRSFPVLKKGKTSGTEAVDAFHQHRRYQDQ